MMAFFKLSINEIVTLMLDYIKSWGDFVSEIRFVNWAVLFRIYIIYVIVKSVYIFFTKP